MLSQNICAHTCVCAGRRPRCKSVQLPGRACVSAGRTRAPARKHFHLNLLTAQALVHLLHSAERRISAASVGSSRRLRHLTASVSMRARTHVCVCVCMCWRVWCPLKRWLRGGRRVLMQLMPNACQGRLVGWTRAGRAPAALIGKGLSPVVCACRMAAGPGADTGQTKKKRIPCCLCFVAKR